MSVLIALCAMLFGYSIIDFFVAAFNYITTRDRKHKYFMKIDFIVFCVCMVVGWIIYF